MPDIRTCQHEARHAIFAALGGFEVEQIDADEGVSIIGMAFAPQELPACYEANPEGTRDTLVAWLTMAHANGRYDTSHGDWYAGFKYFKTWPVAATPHWSILESAAKIEAARLRMSPAVSAMVQYVAHALMQTPVLAGDALRAVLAAACDVGLKASAAAEDA